MKLQRKTSSFKDKKREQDREDEIILKNTYTAIRMQFDEKLFALEAELSNFGPRKRVNLGLVLKYGDAEVNDGQRQRHVFVVAGCMQPHAVHFNLSGSV